MQAIQTNQVSPGTNIKLIVFDMGGVFIRYEWPTVCQGFANAVGITGESFSEIFNKVNQYQYDRGTISTTELVNRLNKAFDFNWTESEFTALWNASLDEDLQMTELLQQLRQQFPLYLLSNNNDSHFTFVENKFNISRHFKEMILSHKLGYIKPEREIYEEVLKRSGMQPSQCLFIDDLKVNIHGARSVGLNAVQFIGIENLHQSLTDFGIKI